jgi:hypothetical protein
MPAVVVFSVSVALPANSSSAQQRYPPVAPAAWIFIPAGLPLFALFF